MDMHSPANDVHDDFINNLESTFSESLHIHDAQKPDHGPEWDGNCDMGEGKICGALEQQETERNKKCLKKCSTFPSPDMMLPPSYSDDENETSLTECLSEQSPHQTNSCSISLPAPPKLSAMKGGREKQGVPQMKLTVKWAPDVYDPVPTLLSRTVKSKKQQKFRYKKSEKKTGKKGQKGYSSKRGSGKDKQHFRKLGGASDLSYMWMDSHDKVVEASPELDALDVGSNDSYCGTSFLKKSVTQVHCPVAEAL